MRRFTDLYLELDGRNSTCEKTRHPTTSRRVEDEDAAWAIAFSREPPEGLGSRDFCELCLEVADCPSWLFEECRTAVGDLGDDALLLPPCRGDPDETLATVMPTACCPWPPRRGERRMVREAWAALGLHERLVYHKLVRGGFRVGVQRQTVAALAALGG